MRALFLALMTSAATAATAAATDAHAPAAPAATAAPAAATTAAPARAVLPPFAAVLAQRPMITNGSVWHGATGTAAWGQLAKANNATRQSIRWNYALALIGEGHGDEAMGVLETMRTADRDLALVAPYQLARGAALTLLGRDQEAVESLSSPLLANNPEACAWRLRALAHAGDAGTAIGEINCAVSAINGRAPIDRAPFILAASAAAIEAGQPKPALEWLTIFNDRNAEANVLRGRAMIANGDAQGGRLRLARAQLSGVGQTQADARLGLIEADYAAGTLTRGQTFNKLDALRLAWRGGPVEERALRLQMKLATEANSLPGQLRVGATLLRYFRLGAEAGPMLTHLQGLLKTALAPGSRVPLPEAAGLYWDYRELAPTGGDGDMLVMTLADRLQSVGLYARAAELLQYQLTARAKDVAQGPLSVKVASLQILAGRPDLALKAIQTTEQPSYTDRMRWDRKRMEAIALHRLGRDAAATAALETIPGGKAVRAEIFWRAKDWGNFVTDSEGGLPPAKNGLDEASQAQVLRYATALAMLGREDKLQALRARYAGAFKGLPTASAFDMLTRKVDAIDPENLAAAMAAIPEASPAGAIGDLLDANP